MFYKSVIKKPYMFRSLLYDHPQGLSFVLSASTTFPLLASSFAFLVCGRMHCIADSIQPHTEKANDEASSGKVVNALSTKDNP
jgi:hypothetical protein